MEATVDVISDAEKMSSERTDDDTRDEVSSGRTEDETPDDAVLLVKMVGAEASTGKSMLLVSRSAVDVVKGPIDMRPGKTMLLVPGSMVLDVEVVV